MLEVRDLAVSYGGVRAVDGVSLEVRRGEVVSIIGMNGAGKTSILNAISGIVPPAAGEIRFEGASIGGLPPHAVVARGIVQVPEGRLIFGTLSVEENLGAAAHQRGGFLLRRRARPDLRRLFPALADKLDRPAASLSGGEAQMLALARGIESEPRLLLLDEPSLGPVAQAVGGRVRAHRPAARPGAHHAPRRAERQAHPGPRRSRLRARKRSNRLAGSRGRADVRRNGSCSTIWAFPRPHCRVQPGGT